MMFSYLLFEIEIGLYYLSSQFHYLSCIVLSSLATSITCLD